MKSDVGISKFQHFSHIFRSQLAFARNKRSIDHGKSQFPSSTIPEDWKEDIIIPIFKKGDQPNCEKIQRHFLLSTCYRIISNILLSKLTSFTEDTIEVYQCGLRRNRSTTDQIFRIRQLLDKKWEIGEAIHRLFVDVKRALDSIKRTKMYQILVCQIWRVESTGVRRAFKLLAQVQIRKPPPAALRMIRSSFTLGFHSRF